MPTRGSQILGIGPPSEQFLGKQGEAFDRAEPVGFQADDVTEASPASSADRTAVQFAATELSERPTICILALSAIADDPRVRRQAEVFHRAG